MQSAKTETEYYFTRRLKMNNFVPQMKVSIKPKTKSYKKEKNTNTIKNLVCNVSKRLSAIDEFLNINIVFSNKN